MLIVFAFTQVMMILPNHEIELSNLRIIPSHTYIDMDYKLLLFL